MNHVMIDIETLGTSKNAVTISLGAVFFDRESGRLGSSFYQTITRDSCEIHGLDADESTVQWWSEQSAEARAVLTCPDAGELDNVLREFAGWLWENTEEGEDIHLWGNGPSFDNAILGNAYDRCGIKLPWQYRFELCVRTVVDMGRELLGIDPKKTIERKGTHHHALADVEHQSLYVSEIYQAFKQVISSEKNMAKRVVELSSERDALAAKVEQLQKEVFKLQCFDVDVIRCLKTIAFEHNRADIPRYQQLARDCMDRISAGNKANELAAQAGRDGFMEGWHQRAYHGNQTDKADSYANQIRQQFELNQSNKERGE